jgi:heat shock protein HslJ
MLQKIIVWALVFLIIPVAVVSGIYLIYGQKSWGQLEQINLWNDTTKNLSLLMGGDKAGSMWIEILAWTNIKVPLFDTVILPLKDGTMTFSSENKSFVLTQTYPIIASTGLVLLPTQVQEEGGQSYNFITAFVKAEDKWVQKQSVFLGNKIRINTLSYWSGILLADFQIPWADSKEVDENAKQLKKYFAVDKGHISPYYPNINNGLIKDMAIISGVWIWKETILSDGKKVAPKKAGIFWIKMNEEWEFSATTDCNSIIGKFTMDDVSIDYTEIGMTEMACTEPSDQDLFVSYLKKVKKYDFKDEQFIFLLPDNSKVIFEMMKK